METCIFICPNSLSMEKYANALNLTALIITIKVSIKKKKKKLISVTVTRLVVRDAIHNNNRFLHADNSFRFWVCR